VECASGGKPISVFYDLYIRWLEQRARQRRIPISLARWLGRRREPLRRFEAVAQAFGDACRIWVARLEGQPVAASILLIFGANAVYWRNASDKESAGSTRANDLLQRLMIGDACTAGCRYYHMGESGGVDSLMHFKSRFGAVAYRYFEYYKERLPFANATERIHGLGKGIEEKLRGDAGKAKV
jgi:lipid II:glycine glycyltransferase (peptidoglycan interpeptide bridge formation enzyme)